MTLFAFLGLWPTLGVGAGAVLIPVIIHLINRRRYKIVPWAAMKFLLAAQKQTRKRMRIEQLLLLLVRMMILAMVLFAMVSVMPWAEAIWQQLGLAHLGQAKRTHRVHHVFVLDASLSMNQTVESGQSAFEVARQLALKKIQDNPSGDGYSVLVLKDNPTWLVGEASQDARKVSREIETAKAGHGNSSLPAALNMISAKLNEASQKFPVQAVYFFTDMQRTTWVAAAGSEIRTDPDGKERNSYLEIEKKATAVFVDVGPMKDAPNLAVTDIAIGGDMLYVTSGVDVPITATLENFSADLAKDVRLELLLGKAREQANDAPLQMRIVDEQTIPVLAAKERRVVSFKTDFKFPTPGTYVVQAKISGDALEPDDARAVVISVRDTIPVLLVNGKASPARFDRATEYLRFALQPDAPGAESKMFPLRPKVINPSQFSQMTEAELENYDCVFWCDVGQFGVADVRKIDAHLRRGGGFIVTLGDKAAENLDGYNRLLYKDEQGILPAKLMKKIVAPPEHRFYFSNADNSVFSLPPLQPFADAKYQLSLRTPNFRQFVQAIVPEGKARTVLTFMPEVANLEKVKRDDTLPINAPALIEWNPPLSRAQQPAVGAKPAARVERQLARYRGKVILLTSGVNMDWANWPLLPSYGAMMHELTRLAITGRLREQSQTVGSILEAYLPGGAELDVTLAPPNVAGLKPVKVRTQLIDEANLFRSANTEYSGIYRLDTTGNHELPFAVNVPVSAVDQKGSESDLARIDETKLIELYPGWKFQVVRDPLRAQISGGPVNDDAVDVFKPMGPTLANIAFLFVLALLFIEIALAWLFGHYTTTEGALSETQPGMTGTIVAAVIAVFATIIFVVGACLIVSEKVYGDFLGFLPEILRAWFEKDQPAAGEGRSWHLEMMPFLFGLPGPENWYAVFLSLGALATIFFTYKAEAPRVSLTYKLLLGALRLQLILLTVWFLLPRPQLQFDRTAWPDIVVLIDDTRSMGEPDIFQAGPVIERVKKLSESIRQNLQEELPAKIAALENEIAAKTPAAVKDLDVKAEVDGLQQRLQYWLKQRDSLNTNKWRPSRLQLVQAILAQPEPHWLKTFLTHHKTKVHIFHLDVNGRAIKLRDKEGDAGDLVDPADMTRVERAAKAIARLEPVGDDSRLGTAIKQVIDHYRGSSMSNVIMFTDGVTTRDETIAQASDYAGQRGVSLYFVGVGDEHELRDLKLHDLQVEDTIYVGDRAVFEVKLTGQGYKDLVVPLILKVKGKDGKEREVARIPAVKVDPSGKSIRLRLTDQPKEVGRKQYIIEVEQPKQEGNEKPIPRSNLRIERVIEVIDTKLIKVLFVEGQPRYEFRYLKFLLEREALDAKQKKSIELKVLLLDADPDFHKQDKTALQNFPPTLKDLNEYDVLVLGDCDPGHKMLQNHLRDVASFVRGEDEKGRKGSKPGGGLLLIAGALHNPHKYKGTALADVIPVEPTVDRPPPDVARAERLRADLTPAGRQHPVFRFSPDENANLELWQRLTPMYWFASKFKTKPLAEVLAVHPSDKAEAKDPNQDGRQPVVVQQFVGTGRSMFFGFDETWRWRKDDEAKYNNFWVQTMRYLSRGRSTRTDLRLDRQTPYRTGEPIKITVRFPDNTPGGPNQPGPKVNEKTDVKVTVSYQPTDAKEADSQVHTIQLAKVEGSWGTYEGTWTRTREGKYRFRLTNPDVSATQPDNEKPGAEATVELPPGELDKLRMNYQEMIQASESTLGRFYTLATADKLLEEMPPPGGLSISSSMPPTLLWNQWWVFVLVVFLITSEWILRKLKHLL